MGASGGIYSGSGKLLWWVLWGLKTMNSLLAHELRWHLSHQCVVRLGLNQDHLLHLRFFLNYVLENA